MGKINTSFGVYKYQEKLLYLGKKKINKDVSRRNLIIFKRILDASGIKFGLLYGTLLGAVREGDFIGHDEDIDLFILAENFKLFLDLLFVLNEEGFNVARFDEGGFLSLSRDNEYIDIYFFHSYNKIFRNCCGHLLPDKFLTDLDELPFLGKTFYAPRHYIEFFEFEYGCHWKIPKEYKQSSFDIFLSQIRTIVKIITPPVIKKIILKVIKQKRLNNSLSKLKKHGYLMPTEN